MSHYSMPITLSPALSALKSKSTPFVSDNDVAGSLVIDVGLNHIDVDFSTDFKDPVYVSHESGCIYIKMPKNINGVAADHALLDERGESALKMLVFSADFTSEGVAVRSPKEYANNLSFILGRARDFSHMGSTITLEADAMSMAQLDVAGIGKNGNKVKKFSSGLAFQDRITGEWLDTQEKVDQAVEARLQAGLAYGVLIRGLDKKLKHLMLAMTEPGFVVEDQLESSLQSMRKTSRTFSSLMKQLSEAESFEFSYREADTKESTEDGGAHPVAAEETRGIEEENGSSGEALQDSTSNIKSAEGRLHHKHAPAFSRRTRCLPLNFREISSCGRSANYSAYFAPYLGMHHGHHADSPPSSKSRSGQGKSGSLLVSAPYRASPWQSFCEYRVVRSCRYARAHKLLHGHT